MQTDHIYPAPVKDPAAKAVNLLKLRAWFKRERLPKLCALEKRFVADALRVAFHLVHQEDIQQRPPRPCTPAIALAKEIHRLEHRAEDPDYPKSWRRHYLEGQANFAQFASRLRSGDFDLTLEHAGGE